MKSNWMPVLEFMELFDKSKATIHSQVFHHTKQYGIKPEWYRMENGTAMVNASYFTYAADLKAKCHKYSTSPTVGIYWYLMNYVTEMELARKMIVYSRKFKSERSWLEFFNKTMWRHNPGEVKVITKMERGQIEEFIVYGSFILHSLANRLGVREHEI